MSKWLALYQLEQDVNAACRCATILCDNGIRPLPKVVVEFNGDGMEFVLRAVDADGDSYVLRDKENMTIFGAEIRFVPDAQDMYHVLIDMS